MLFHPLGFMVIFSKILKSVKGHHIGIVIIHTIMKCSSTHRYNIISVYQPITIVHSRFLAVLISVCIHKIDTISFNPPWEQILRAYQAEDISLTAHIACGAAYQRIILLFSIPVTFHSIRHSFATRLLERGADIKTASELLGHKSIQITLDIYGHVSANLKSKTIALLD